MKADRNNYSDEGRWPNLYLIGAPKSATTFLHDLIGLHEQIFTSEHKEPAFFHYDGNMPSHEKASAAPIYAILSQEKYLSIYKNSRSHKYVVDASTHYLSSPETAARIYSVQPDSYIVAVLREPIGRAYSHYLMGRRDGYVVEDFSTALAREEREMSQPNILWGEHYRFIRRSQYLKGIQKYHSAFGSRFKVYKFEDLKDNLELVLEDLGEFLGLNLSSVIDQQRETQRNSYAEDRFPTFTKALNSYRGSKLRHIANAVIPRSARKRIRGEYDRIRMRSAPKPDLTDENKKKLESYLNEDYIESLRYSRESGLLFEISSD